MTAAASSTEALTAERSLRELTSARAPGIRRPAVAGSACDRLAERERIVAEARRWIGTPYHHQASCRGAGCDCVGLVRGVWRELIGPEPEKLPAYSGDWGDVTGQETVLQTARRHLTEIPVDDAGPGDVIAFRIRHGRMAKHCGILTTADRFIHAWEVAPVAEVALSDWWRRRIVAAFSYPERTA